MITIPLPLSATLMIISLLFWILVYALRCLSDRLFGMLLISDKFVLQRFSKYWRFSKYLSRVLFRPFSGTKFDFLTNEGSLSSFPWNISSKRNFLPYSCRPIFNSGMWDLGAGVNLWPIFKTDSSSLDNLYDDKFVILGLTSLTVVVLLLFRDLKRTVTVNALELKKWSL